jgi:hypothetical protein
LLHAINCFARVLQACDVIAEPKTFQEWPDATKSAKKKGRRKAGLFPN